jgi:hypothetical protein
MLAAKPACILVSYTNCQDFRIVIQVKQIAHSKAPPVAEYSRTLVAEPLGLVYSQWP